MSSYFKCSLCDEKAAFGSRQAVNAAGWALVEIQTREKCKYYVFCSGCVPGVDWLRKALDGKRDKGAGD